MYLQKKTCEYFYHALKTLNELFGHQISEQPEESKKIIKKYCKFMSINDNRYTNISKKEIDGMFNKKLKDISFDTIIMNPPYSGTLYLDFFEKAIQIIKNTKGEIVIISPAGWLIDINNKKNIKKYKNIKNQISKHVKSVIIENFNEEFNTNLTTPFSITHIDMSQIYSEIDFTCFGYNSKQKDINDCNLVGEYDIIKSILEKVSQYNDFQKNHIYKKNQTKINENTYFCEYEDVFRTTSGKFCSHPNKINSEKHNNTVFIKLSNGYFYEPKWLLC